MENHTWTVRICGETGDLAQAFVRKHRFAIGAPVQFDEAYPRITALEYALGAIGADIVNGLQYLSRKRRVPIDDIECMITGQLDNPLTHIGVVGETGHPGIAKIEAKVYIRSFEPEADIRRIWEEMRKKSPLIHTFENAVELNLSMQIVF